MISFLEGKIILKKEKFVIIEVAGIGYKVFLSRQSLSRLSEGNRGSSIESGLKLPAFAPEELRQGKPEIGSVKFFIYHDIKEDKSDLYGFLTYEELEFFETLNDIRGIGPKAALELSVVGPLEKIKNKILNQDENVFAGIPGIGQKRAMTIILELTGKIKQLGQKSSSADEAENALVQLGFSKQQAKEALSQISPSLKTEDRIKQALKSLRR